MFVGVIHHNDDTANARDQIHSTAHTFDQFAGDHPVGKVTFFINLHRAQNSGGDFAATDHAKALRTVKVSRLRKFSDGLLARINQVGVDVFLSREGAHAQHAVFRLQRYLDPFGDVVGHQRRDADSEVHICAVFEFLRRTCGHLVSIPCHDLNLPALCVVRYVFHDHLGSVGARRYRAGGWHLDRASPSERFLRLLQRTVCRTWPQVG